jgi:two-component system, NtrC family, sensor kinase
LKKCAFRIIVPIYHLNQLLGIIVILSQQKRELNDELDILESIAAQLGNAIIQAQLYEKDVKTVAELQLALKELKDTQVQLINSEKMASLGQLIAGVAHEINTPLASINSNNAIISKLIKKLDNAEMVQVLKEINELDHEAVTRISNMVKSLKKFVRLDEADLQEADINKELDLTLDLIRHETKNRIEIVRNYGELPLIKCYPNMLNQVFMNILINACQSIDKSGQITITTNFKDNILTVKIEDSGKGMAPDKVDKIFTAGYTTKGVGVGTGLGLAISDKIIQKHKGKINVNSTLGLGSEFIITIPS